MTGREFRNGWGGLSGMSIGRFGLMPGKEK